MLPFSYALLRPLIGSLPDYPVSSIFSVAELVEPPKYLTPINPGRCHQSKLQIKSFKRLIYNGKTSRKHNLLEYIRNRLSHFPKGRLSSDASWLSASSNAFIALIQAYHCEGEKDDMESDRGY